VVDALETHAGDARERREHRIQVLRVADLDDDVVEGLAGLAGEDVDAGDVAGGGPDRGGDAAERAGAVGHPEADPGQHVGAPPDVAAPLGTAHPGHHRPARTFHPCFTR
jgi:hypothetical protein